MSFEKSHDEMPAKARWARQTSFARREHQRRWAFDDAQSKRHRQHCERFVAHIPVVSGNDQNPMPLLPRTVEIGGPYFTSSRDRQVDGRLTRHRNQSSWSPMRQLAQVLAQLSGFRRKETRSMQPWLPRACGASRYVARSPRRGPLPRPGNSLSRGGPATLRSPRSGWRSLLRSFCVCCVRAWKVSLIILLKVIPIVSCLIVCFSRQNG